jgi:hypothetical protein
MFDLPWILVKNNFENIFLKIQNKLKEKFLLVQIKNATKHKYPLQEAYSKYGHHNQTPK